jgi:predicted DNA-binding transcriptional regulator YafY
MRQDLRLFALHRIQQYELTQESFQPMDQENLESWLKSPLFIEHKEQEEHVSIKFAPRAARYIKEKIWHPTQALKDHEDGSCTLSFTTAGLDEVRRWVLGYGADAVVVEPPTLRSAIVDELKLSLNKYGA